jgi:hypothetical protein
MEYSIPIPQGKLGIGMEWNGMEFGIFYCIVWYVYDVICCIHA